MAVQHETMEVLTQVFFDSYANAEGQGGAGDGQIRGTGTYYSEVFAIPKGEMPADLIDQYKNTLNQSVVCTLQGCNSSDFSTTPVHDLPGAITLTDGSVTAQEDYGTGPDRFGYYRIKAVTSGSPASGVLLAWFKMYAE